MSSLFLETSVLLRILFREEDAREAEKGLLRAHPLVAYRVLRVRLDLRKLEPSTLGTKKGDSKWRSPPSTSAFSRSFEPIG